VPLTFAHPAASIPLKRLLGRAGVVSALVVGSVVPDLHYFVPLPISRDATHSLAGLLWFCLPVGLLTYWAFHRALAQPLLALLPDTWQSRLARLLDARARRPAAPGWAVAVSILAGALTHLAWDAFTHGTDPVIEALPILDVRLATISGYPLSVRRVLLHGSSLIGLALLTWWSTRWLRRAEPSASAPAPRLRPALRAAILAGLVSAAALAALPAVQLPARVTLRSVQRCVVKAAAPAFAALGTGTLLYCALWHGLRAARRPTRPI
jgi:hypothetical protein